MDKRGIEHLPGEFVNRVWAGAHELIALASRMTVTPIFGSPPPAPFAECKTACGVLLRHPSGLVMLTAEHVVADWEARLATDPSVVMQLDECIHCSVPKVTYRDTANDLVALSLGNVDESRLVTVPHEPRWPLSTPSVGDTVYFCGYPKVLRQDNGTGALFADFSASVSVTSVGEEYFVCQFQREDWLDWGYGETPPVGTVLGGMSGAPVFMMAELYYPLVGVISQFGENLDLLRVATLKNLPPLDELVG